MDRFDTEYNRILEESELVNEIAPLAAAALVGAPLLAGGAALLGLIPDGMKKLAEESYLYMALSYVDPTGILSWGYLGNAFDKWSENPEDSWNNVYLIFSFLACIPVVGLGVKTIGRLLLGIVKSPKRITDWVSGVAKTAGSSSRITKDAIPSVLAGLYGTTFKNGADKGAVLRKAFSYFGIKIEDRHIVQAIYRKGYNTNLQKNIGKAKIDDYIKASAEVGYKKLGLTSSILLAKQGIKPKSLAKTVGVGAAKLGAKAAAGIGRAAGKVGRIGAVGGAAYNQAAAEKGAKALGDILKSNRTSPLYGPKTNLVGRIGATTPSKF